jgi:long-chain acyl-CoA synthetase
MFAFDRTGTVTYGEADEKTEAIAAGLVGRGITNGAPLGLSGPDSIDLWLAILGAWKAGALPSMIDARTPRSDLAYFLRDISADLLAASPELDEGLRAAGATSIVNLHSLSESIASRTTRSRHGKDSPIFLSYTSGTTGAPKGAVLTSGPVTLGTACIAERLTLSAGDILLATTPTSSSFQLVAAVMPAMHVGATVGLLAGSSPSEIWEVARRQQASILVGYPLTLSDMVNAPDAALAPSSFRLALSGGSPLAPRIKRDYRDLLAIPLVESYGQSELGGFMALGAPSDNRHVMAGFVGRPLPDRLAYIGGPDCKELSSGEVGEVLVREGYFAGYWNSPEKSSEVLDGGVLHTGDLGVANPDGYMKVLGRTREADAAKRRGGFLREVEDSYYDHPSVQHAAVVECEEDGEVEAFVELRAGHALGPELLTEFVASRVPEGLRPRHCTILDQMPRTFSGKANRMKLAAECHGPGAP